MARILIMEDDPDQGMLLAAALGGAGHDPRHVQSARDAWVMLNEGPYDLLLTDIFVHVDGNLTGDGGLLLISRMRAPKPGAHARRLRTMPVIAISGGGHPMRGPQVFALARDMGADLLLRKPIDLDRLIDEVETLLEDSASRELDRRRAARERPLMPQHQ
ncbi:MAG: response regulator [Pseudomonadota bacterium]